MCSEVGWREERSEGRPEVRSAAGMHELTRIDTNLYQQGQVLISPGDDGARLMYESFVSIREIRAEMQVDAPSTHLPTLSAYPLPARPRCSLLFRGECGLTLPRIAEHLES